MLDSKGMSLEDLEASQSESFHSGLDTIRICSEGYGSGLPELTDHVKRGV